MRYDIQIPIHMTTQNIFVEWGGALLKLLDILTDPLKVKAAFYYVRKIPEEVNLNGRALRRELEKIIALYERSQDDDTIREIIENIDLSFDLRRIQYGMTNYYVWDIKYKSDVVHPLVFHKAMLMTNQEASFFSTVILSRIHDRSRYDATRYYLFRYEFEPWTTQMRIFSKRPLNENDIKQKVEEAALSFLPHPAYAIRTGVNTAKLLIEYDYKEQRDIQTCTQNNITPGNPGYIPECHHKFTNRQSECMRNCRGNYICMSNCMKEPITIETYTYPVSITLSGPVEYQVYFRYVKGTLNENILDGEVQLLPVIPPHYRKDNKDQWIFADNYPQPSQITYTSPEKKKKSIPISKPEHKTEHPGSGVPTLFDIIREILTALGLIKPRETGKEVKKNAVL